MRLLILRNYDSRIQLDLDKISGVTLDKYVRLCQEYTMVEPLWLASEFDTKEEDEYSKYMDGLQEQMVKLLIQPEHIYEWKKDRY